MEFIGHPRICLLWGFFHIFDYSFLFLKFSLILHSFDKKKYFLEFNRSKLINHSLSTVRLIYIINICLNKMIIFGINSWNCLTYRGVVYLENPFASLPSIID